MFNWTKQNGLLKGLITPRRFVKPTGYEVFRWPEFLAFARRLGIPLEHPIRDLDIHIPVQDHATVDISFLAEDTTQVEEKE